MALGVNMGIKTTISNQNGFDLEISLLISQLDTPPDEACWLRAEI